MVTRIRQSEDRVDAPSLTYQEMAEQWELIRALRSTSLMRDGGEKFLPIEEAESPAHYSIRLARTFLYPAYYDTVDRLSGRPFVKPVVLTSEADLPVELHPLIDNADLVGNDLTQFAKSVFTDGIDHGLSFILVDYPKSDVGLTKKQEMDRGLRPYFIHIPAVSLIGLKWHPEPGTGYPIIDQIRVKEIRVEEEGEFGEREVPYIRVYSQTTVQDWRHDPDNKATSSEGVSKRRSGEYTLIDEWIHTFGQVPIEPFYANAEGFYKASPPMYRLAEVNLAHYQSYSDHRNLIRFIRFALLFLKGLSQDDIKKKRTTVGPGRVIRTTSKDADGKYIEHTGKGATASREELKDLEAWMEILGMQPLMTRSGGQTATGQAIDESRAQSDIQAWIRSLEQTLYRSFLLAAKWVKKPLPDDLKVEIFSDFSIGLRSQEEIKNLVEMRDKKLITHWTFLNEVKRRGLLAETVDPDDELDDLEDEMLAEGDSISDDELDAMREEILQLKAKDLERGSSTSPATPEGGPDPEDE